MPALVLNGDALEDSRHAGSNQRLPTTEGSQTASSVPRRSGSEPKRTLTWRACSPSQYRVTSTMTTTACQCSTKSETSPAIGAMHNGNDFLSAGCGYCSVTVFAGRQ